MRPLVLKMSAFGPYASETVIPMKDLGTKGLYLITGDTGAGKTTIFDAICYALYGEASGDIRDNSMLRSKYADNETPTEVDLTFSHNDKEYRVVRNPEYERPAKRGDGFTKQTAGACLYMPDGKIISKTTEVTKAVEELMGITRSQFSQIAMIAQGDFKKLLLSDTDDRQIIFRKLFKTDNYLELQKSLEKKRKEIYGEVEDGKKSVNQYINEIKADDDDVLSLDVKEIKKGQYTIEDTIEILDKIIAKDKEAEELRKQELSEVNKKLETVNSNIGAAETASKARYVLEEAQKNLEIEIPNEKILKEKFEKAKGELVKKEEYTKTIPILDVEIKKHDDIAKCKLDVENAKKESTKIADLIKNKEEKKEKEEAALLDIKKELESLKGANVSIEKFRTDLEKNLEKIELIEELERNNNTCDKNREALKIAQEKYAKDNASFIELKQIYDRKEQAFRDGQAGILAESLTDGMMCPVCGSTSHPHKAQCAENIPSEAELEKAKAAMEKARKVANESSIEAGNKKTSLEIKEAELIKSAKKIIGTDNLDKIKDVILSKKEEATSAVNAIRETIKKEEEKIERKKLLEDKLIPEKENEIKSIEKSIGLSREQLSSLQAKITEISNQIESIKTTLTMPGKNEAEEKKEELLIEVDRIQTEYNNVDSELKKCNEKIAKFKAEIDSSKKTLEGQQEIDFDIEKEKKRTLENKRDEIIMALQVVGSRTDKNEYVLSNIIEQSQKVVETEKKLQWISALSKTANGDITGKEKIKLETYIQTTYFDRIIDRANLRFMEMSGGQYELKRQRSATDKKSQSGLELSVIDHYNGTERSVKTLSGGESFMASLSLALGLSDEVQSSAGGIIVDTMFVDEGFGSLDTDSLDQAYRALSGITEGNRLVGIISHVSELKSKIDNQIIITKEKSGGSFAMIQV